MSTVTRNITTGLSPFVITREMKVLTLSFKMSSTTNDAGTFTGDGTLVDGNGVQYPSQALAIGAGEGQAYVASGVQNPISGTLTVSQGTMKVIFGL